MEKICVIMSTYNGEKYIAEQIESIFQQENCEISLLVRDDGSTDSTLKILYELSKKYTIKIINGENIGPQKSFITALANSEENFQFYAFADQDDVWKKNKLISAIEQIKQMDNSKPVSYFSNLTSVDENLKVIKEKILPENVTTKYEDLLTLSDKIFGCTQVFNKKTRDIVVKSQYDDVCMHDLYITLVTSLVGETIYDKNSYIFYRQHGNNVSGTNYNILKKMKSRLKKIYGVNKNKSYLKAKNILKLIDNSNLTVDNSKKYYTEMVANYNKSFKNKCYYIKNMAKGNLSNKRLLFYCFLVILGNA